MMNLEVTED